MQVVRLFEVSFMLFVYSIVCGQNGSLVFTDTDKIEFVLLSDLIVLVKFAHNKFRLDFPLFYLGASINIYSRKCTPKKGTQN